MAHLVQNLQAPVTACGKMTPNGTDKLQDAQGSMNKCRECLRRAHHVRSA